MPITLEELAKAAGVSVSTVSRALTNSSHAVNEKTRQRILKLAEELGYRPNLLARSLRTDRSLTVGIITDDVSSPFSPIIIRGAQDYLRGQGYFSIIMNGDFNPDVERTAIRDLVSRAIDGVLFVESWHRQANEELDIASTPYVFVHRLFAASYRYSVIPDEQYGARLATGHLLKLGHRRIGYINGPEKYYSSQDRLIGYQQELSAAGIAFDPALVERGDWEMQSGYEAAARLLALPEPPTAFFVANDLMAVGAIYAVQDAGLTVPDDIAIVGYDDRTVASLSRPALTTVTLPCYEMGQASARLLLTLLDNQPAAEEEIKVPGRLIIRQSCGSVEGKRANEHASRRIRRDM